MLRKLGIGFIALATITPGLAAALGVGEYELNSYLNEPLDMTVELQDLGDLSKDQILVELASQEQFDAAGVERSYFLNSLEFQINLEPGGDGGELRITSQQPVREPYLDFLVEFLWPTGRLMREYTVLLDPPSYADDAGSVAPAVSEAPPRLTPRSEPAPQRNPPRADTTTAPPPSSTEADRPRASRPAAAEPSRAPASTARTYRVRSSDTLWRIADRSRPSTRVSVQQMMLAIQERNPDAFINDNVNLVREGAVLRLPDEEQVRDLSNSEALSRVAAQNQEWQRLRDQRAATPDRAPVDATGREAVDRAAEDGDGEGRVTLVTPDSTDGVSDGDGTGAGAPGQASTAALQNELAIRDENLDRLQRENEELRSRIGDLGDQVSTSQQLLELRNEKIAALQEELRRLSEEQGADIDPRLMEEEPVPAVDTDTDTDTDTETGTGTDSVAADDEAMNLDEPAELDSGDATGMPRAADEGDDAAGTAAGGADNGGTDTAAPPANDEPSRTRPASDTPAATSAGGGIVDTILDNLLYLGAALLVLLLLLLLAVRRRRNGGDDDDHAGPDDDDGGFDETPLMASEHDDEPADTSAMQEDLDDEHMDPMERADVYVAYGQYPQAVDYLRNEINQAPERADLKIRLLELLREMNDDSGFKQQAAMFAGGSAAVDAAIKRLGGDPGDQDYGAIADDPAEDDDAEEELSLDDLELDLASDLPDSDESTVGASSFAGASAAEDDERDDGQDSGLDLEDFDFRLDDDDDQGDGDDELVLDRGEPAAPGAGLDEGERFEFTLDDDAEAGDASFTEEELSALDDAAQYAPERAGGEPGDLDLDDLDLDLGEVDTDDATATGATIVDAERPGDDAEDPHWSLDDLDLGDDDAREDRPADNSLAFEDDEPAAPASDPLDDLALELDDEAPAGTDEAEPTRPAAPSLDESVPATASMESDDDMLGDDDDFDFLGETDENATKLDLARAYIDMGDAEGARDILNEVLSEGTEEQQGEARELLARVG